MNAEGEKMLNVQYSMLIEEEFSSLKLFLLEY